MMFLLAVAESPRCGDQHYMRLNVLDNVASDLSGCIAIDICRKRRDCIGQNLIPLVEKTRCRTSSRYLLINGVQLCHDIFGRSDESRSLIIC
jgi:hypothetical protein